ncbi:hypothetical protein YpMG051020_3565 [Yersinia pestis biovar Orientalis str. MG05-1020]|nr:hypothetical protein YpF1991016_3711 [Yersinia pestis biovar Orientalis str. F1991016]EDR57867.1 hypothetical protein YpMG051020_3565 [Yersinia pestis biovar Orientalis str. MG05-1020]
MRRLTIMNGLACTVMMGKLTITLGSIMLNVEISDYIPSAR